MLRGDHCGRDMCSRGTSRLNGHWTDACVGVVVTVGLMAAVGAVVCERARDELEPSGMDGATAFLLNVLSLSICCCLDIVASIFFISASFLALFSCTSFSSLFTISSSPLSFSLSSTASFSSLDTYMKSLSKVTPSSSNLGKFRCTCTC